MAIEKDIAIHHTHGIENVITYTKDPEKSNIFLNRRAKENGMDIEQLILQGEEQDIINALSYAENLEKTILQLDGDEQLLTSGVLCKKDHAAFITVPLPIAATGSKAQKKIRKPVRPFKRKASKPTTSSSPSPKSKGWIPASSIRSESNIPKQPSPATSASSPPT